MLKLLFSLCIYLYLTKPSFQVCEESSFSSNYVVLTCTNKTQSFPVTKRPVFMLKCLDCYIPVLDEKTVLKNFVGDTFNLSNSHVQVISSNAFKSFRPTIRRFLLKNNEFNYIAPKVFNNFSALIEISFRNSRIVQLDPNTFDGTIVAHLDLSNNFLSNVSRIFDGLRTSMLNLSTNRISEISVNAFDAVSFGISRYYGEFSILDLSNNLIQKIYPNTFKSADRIRAIRMLSLSKNLIKTIESRTFSNSTFLMYLLLDNNLISELNSDSFKGLTNLISLSLNKNRIQKIPTSLFADLQNLQALDLSQNALTALNPTTFSGLQHLQFLNISHNNLRVFEDAHLFPLMGLVGLDITDIKIHTLNLKTILQHHWRLVQLVINDNFWVCKDLTKMYKQLSKQMNGFTSPAEHFDVPNLHGIACSKQELKSYSSLTFSQFLSIIAQEGTDPNSFIDDDVPTRIIDVVLGHISVIKSMTIVIAIVLIVLFLNFVVRCIVFGLQHYNILRSSRFTFFYNQNQDTVKVLS